MKRQLKEFRRLRMICLEQARAASTELEKNAFLEIAEQYQQAESSALFGPARRAGKAVGMNGGLRLQSRRLMGEFRARAGGISVYVSSLFWLAFLLATAAFVAVYVPW